MDNLNNPEPKSVEEPIEQVVTSNEVKEVPVAEPVTSTAEAPPIPATPPQASAPPAPTLVTPSIDFQAEAKKGFASMKKLVSNNPFDVMKGTLHPAVSAVLVGCLTLISGLFCMALWSLVYYRVVYYRMYNALANMEIGNVGKAVSDLFNMSDYGSKFDFGNNVFRPLAQRSNVGMFGFFSAIGIVIIFFLAAYVCLLLHNKQNKPLLALQILANASVPAMIIMLLGVIVAYLSVALGLAIGAMTITVFLAFWYKGLKYTCASLGKKMNGWTKLAVLAMTVFVLGLNFANIMIYAVGS